MARPLKDPSTRRKRWDALYVTDAERADVTAAASHAGLSASQYLLSLHAGGRIVNRNDWRRNVQLLSMVTQQLEYIARSMRDARDAEHDPSQPLQIAASLVELERLVRDQVMPWQAGQQDEAYDDAEGGRC
ncbi:hypothetical protein OS189_17080 [Sulfitobacter sp. F26169L]|uniref:plasmid mobilization protein n=1 Tax=Sulfitobacter sp. F26169L TaxID=2996015 RepID=UPI002260A12B|nr:hypothetical protein [Sulfitobacter sp. F26169L]MCX7568058.1 hypothetical protein [Sulfitobacter sp. F26169L]